MSVEYNPPLSLVPLARIEWERLLPVPGQVLVRVGDKVEATDVIARAIQPGKMFAVDAARELGIGRGALPRYMLKTEGQEVREREILAARGGVFKKKCLSPVTGSIRSVVQGRVLLEREPLAIELRASVRGDVVRIIPNMGVVIRATGAFVRGAWSSGTDAYGVLRVATSGRDEPLTPDLLDASCHGAIVVGGSSVTPEAIRLAEDVKVRAIVLGSMDAAMMGLARAATFPVMVTQGMGDIPMLRSMFDLFKVHQGREAVIMQRQMTRGAMRPELFIPLPLEGGKALPLDEIAAQPLKVGSQVAVTRAPYAGAVGRVVELPKLSVDADTGIRFRGVTVLLSDGEQIMVPLTNLDLLAVAPIGPDED